MHDTNKQFIKTVYLQSNLIHLQQCFQDIFIRNYLCTIFAEIAGKEIVYTYLLFYWVRIRKNTDHGADMVFMDH